MPWAGLARVGSSPRSRHGSQAHQKSTTRLHGKRASPGSRNLGSKQPGWHFPTYLRNEPCDIHARLTTWPAGTESSIDDGYYMVEARLTDLKDYKLRMECLSSDAVPFHSQEWSISNFPCNLTRNITSHNMKNSAFHSLLFSIKGWEKVLFEILNNIPQSSKVGVVPPVSNKSNHRVKWWVGPAHDRVFVLWFAWWSSHTN